MVIHVCLLSFSFCMSCTMHELICLMVANYSIKHVFFYNVTEATVPIKLDVLM